jgi:putative ABC transport system permease protein
MINTMVMSIRDRTSEIGTMRAIGLSRAGVLGLFLLEALILGFAASVVGAAAGAATALGIDALSIQIPIEAVQAILLSDELNLAPRLLHVALSIAGLTLFVGIAALWPSLQAARLEPVDAIHRAR